MICVPFSLALSPFLHQKYCALIKKSIHIQHVLRSIVYPLIHSSRFLKMCEQTERSSGEKEKLSFNTFHPLVLKIHSAIIINCKLGDGRYQAEKSKNGYMFVQYALLLLSVCYRESSWFDERICRMSYCLTGDISFVFVNLGYTTHWKNNCINSFDCKREQRIYSNSCNSCVT